MTKSGDVISSISGCLTLDRFPERKAELAQFFSSDHFDLDNWIRTISEQYVLPAVYLQLERAALLTFLPVDLAEYLGELTEKNRERNSQIMEEVKEISSRLVKKGIEPVFLKGTAHLLLNLYEDPAERMVGDIDFLVPEEDMLSAVDVLLDMGFKPAVKFNEKIHKGMKHYPRMLNYDYAAAVEVHTEVVLEAFQKKFPSSQILNSKQEVPGWPGVFVPSDQLLIVHNMMNAQFNDSAYKNRLVLLRQMYDFLRLADREDPQKALDTFGYYSKQANAWLALNTLFFDAPEFIKYKHSTRLQHYIQNFIWYQNHPKALSVLRVVNYFMARLYRYISFPVNAMYNRQARLSLWARLSDPKWYLNHLKSYVYFFNPNKRFEK